MTRCLNNQEINAEETSTWHLQQRNKHLLQAHEKSEEIVQNLDMQMFLKAKRKGQRETKREKIICLFDLNCLVGKRGVF